MGTRYQRPVTADARAKADAARAKTLEELRHTLSVQVQKLATGPEWKAWLSAAAKFHDYSFNNQLLIWAQRPDATKVAGYTTWQQFGRQVDKGEKGLKILAPVVRKLELSDEQKQALPADRAAPDSPEHRITGFRPVHVWDIAQTSGDPLPGPPADPDAPKLTGAAPGGLWDALAHQVQQAGFTLRLSDTLPRGADGVTKFATREVLVNQNDDDVHRVATLIHELAHVLMHDPTQLGKEDTLSCREVGEVEAESVAYLVATSHGIDTDRYSFSYLAGWAASQGPDIEATMRSTAERVLGTARQILAGTQPVLIDAEQLTEVAERARAGAQMTGRLRTAADALEPTPAVEPVVDVERLIAAHTTAAAFYRQQLLSSPEAEGPRIYLEQRALGRLLDDGDRWEAGYAPPRWNELTTHLRGAGFTDVELEASGLVLRTHRDTLVDRFRDRIMLPIAGPDRRPVAFIGRAPDERGQDTPKYLNNPNTPIFTKSTALFGLAHAPAGTTRAVLVEGPLDVIAAGYAAPALPTVAPLGVAVTDAHGRALAERGVSELVVALDPDAAGRAGAAAAYGKLRPHIPHLLAAELAAGIDPAQLAETRPAELAARLTSTQYLHPLVDLAVDERIAAWNGDKDSPEGRSGAAKHTAAYIVTLPARDVGRQTQRAAATIGVRTDTMTAVVIEAIAAVDSRGRTNGITAAAVIPRTVAQLAHQSYRQAGTAPAPATGVPAAATVQHPHAVSAGRRR